MPLFKDIDPKFLPDSKPVSINENNKRYFYYSKNHYVSFKEDGTAVATPEPVTYIQIQQEAKDLIDLQVYDKETDLELAFAQQTEQEKKAKRPRRKKKAPEKQPVEPPVEPVSEEEPTPIEEPAVPKAELTEEDQA